MLSLNFFMVPNYHHKTYQKTNYWFDINEGQLIFRTLEDINFSMSEPYFLKFWTALLKGPIRGICFQQQQQKKKTTG